MTPEENLDKLEGKDQLMSNLFGQNVSVLTEKKSKSSKRQKKEDGLTSTVMLL